MQIGYTLFAEAFSPQEMVRQAVRAEQAGFDFVEISDHYHPWLESHGHSGFAWSILAVIAAKTERIELATGVTCPTVRYHPAIIAQAAATTALLSDGRFVLGVGRGDRVGIVSAARCACTSGNGSPRTRCPGRSCSWTTCRGPRPARSCAGPCASKWCACANRGGRIACVSAAPNPHGTSFAHRLGWGERPALVVIDMVRAYTEPDGPFALPSPGPALENCMSLVDAARDGGAPVVWTVVRYTSGLADGGLFVRKVPALAAFAEDAPGGWGEIAAPLKPAPGEPVVAKQYASAFSGTSLAATLAVSGVDTLVVCGVSTSGCVRASATDAIAHGLRPMVVGDACADRTTALHDANLADLDAKYADVVAVDDARRALSGTA